MKKFAVGMVSAVVIAASAIAAAAQTAPQAPQAAPAPKSDARRVLPAPTASDIARCGEKVPDGGVPVFLRPETPEQRAARIGIEDPGCDPDLEKHYWRFGKEYTIGKYDRLWAMFGGGEDLNAIRPFGFVNAYRELFQQNEKWVWVWEAVPAPQEAIPEDIRKSTQSERRISDEDVAYLQKIRPEFTELQPKSSGKTIRFEEASDGLPTGGSFRNGMAIADMNGDGFPDIIVPPERAGATGIPAIFLGDGKGHWRYWSEVRWPRGLDYGSVAAGDFNKDGHMDLAFAVHLSGIFVMMGDGKGNFTEVQEGLPRDFPTRRLIVTDVDKDGYPDIITISEGPTAIQAAERTLSKLRVYYNRNKGKKWEGIDVADTRTRMGGDYLSIGNLNGDKYPDIVGASIYFGSADIIYMSKGPKQWSVLNSKVGTTVPFLSYYLASGTGKFSSKKRDDALISYVRFWPPDVNAKVVPPPPVPQTSGIDMLTFNTDGSVVRKPIVREATKFGITGIATGDVDGDGNLDVAFTTYKTADVRELNILLGDGKGNFTQAATEGLKTVNRPTYDLRLADVNGDGRPDVIIMYEADQPTALSPRDGSIHVFLNRGPVTSPASK